MNNNARLSILAFASFLTLSSSFASFAIVGANGGDGEAWEQYVATNAFNQSVQIRMNDGSYGSGGMFNRATFQKGGEDYVKVCFATADHVVRGGNGLNSIVFGGSTAGWSLPGAGNITQISLGGFDGDDDLAFVGWQAKRSELSNDFLTFIDNLAPLAMATPNTTSDAVNYGFGTSGAYTRDGNNDVDGFYWRPNFEDFEVSRGGRHRWVRTDPTAVAAFSLGIYNYDAIKWQVSNATEYGGINQGDSGGVIYQDGKFVGVTTFNNYFEGNDVNGLYRTYALGSNQGGNAFTQNNIDWLGDSCAEFDAVPEPSSMILLAGLGLAAIAKRRKSRA